MYQCRNSYILTKKDTRAVVWYRWNSVDDYRWDYECAGYCLWRYLVVDSGRRASGRYQFSIFGEVFKECPYKLEHTILARKVKWIKANRNCAKKYARNAGTKLDRVSRPAFSCMDGTRPMKDDGTMASCVVGGRERMMDWFSLFINVRLICFRYLMNVPTNLNIQWWQTND